MLNFPKILIVHFKCYVNVAHYFFLSWKAQHLHTHLKCPQAPVHITLNHIHVTVHIHRQFSGILFSNKQSGLVNSGQV